MPKPELPHDIKMALLVGKYATPFAILLVFFGLFHASPGPLVRDVSFALLVFAILFNFIAMAALQQLRDVGVGFVRMRLWVNLGVNIVLVYLLGRYWVPMWLLLVLTPIATAIYDTRRKTLVTAVSVAVLLMVLHALQHLQGGAEWGPQITYGVFIILLSMMVNELTQLSRPPSSIVPK
ncbi:MAG TPA: hypothetical protein PK876_00220 [Elusimicrobiota bacterium]|nr:hypothetical protein [Elusimicrobiota bacterium]